MNVREQLVSFLEKLRAFQVTDERQSLIGNVGFDYLRSKVKWEGDARTFADHLVLVLTREGRQKLLEFLRNLKESDVIGPERKKELDPVIARISTLSRPAWMREFVFVAIPVRWVALGLVFLALAAAPTIWWGYQVWKAPSEMRGTFNIAIADFGQIDRGQVRYVEDGRVLSGWLFNNLLAQRVAGKMPTNNWIWHDSLPVTEKKIKIGVIAGATFEAREQNASRIASSTNANMLVYGTLSAGASPTLTIEFYMAPLRTQAGELVGTYALGVPIPVTLPIVRSEVREQVEAAMISRTEILSPFVRGLSREKYGDYNDALKHFNEANRDELWRDIAGGREVVYLFIGRQHYALGRQYDKGGQKEKALEAYRDAFKAFQQAGKINPDYARAYIGMGNVQYVLDYAKDDDERLNAPCIYLGDLIEIGTDRTLSCLRGAINNYERAVDKAREGKSAGHGVEARAHVALGGAYRVKGLVHQHLGEHAEATASYDKAIEEAKAALPFLTSEAQTLELVLAQSNMGLAYQWKGDIQRDSGNKEESVASYELAHASYSQCVESASKQPANPSSEINPPELRDKCQSLRGDVENELNSIRGNP